VSDAVLSVHDLTLTYGGIVGVRDFRMQVPRGGVVALLGPNGSGKSSALRAVCGEGSVRGSVVLDGADVSRWSPDRRSRAGLVQVPQGGGLFRDMSTRENLWLGAWGRSKEDREASFEDVLSLFPRLEARIEAPAGMLSGGEQQMLAMGRALMGKPKVLLLDEPTIGLAPVAVTEVFEQIEAVAATGTSLVIVDQNAMQALRLATDVCIVNRGRLVYAAPKEQALAEVNIIDAHLGLVAVDELDDATEGQEGVVAVATPLKRRLRAWFGGPA
jgi:branched-chain amino acid transport system ATP-binding protein